LYLLFYDYFTRYFGTFNHSYFWFNYFRLGCSLQQHQRRIQAFQFTSLVERFGGDFQTFFRHHALQRQLGYCEDRSFGDRGPHGGRFIDSCSAQEPSAQNAPFFLFAVRLFDGRLFGFRARNRHLTKPMATFRISLQLLLFLIFAVGGGYRFIQPVDVLAKKMLWVSYFDPLIVRAISIVEVVCGIGIVLPFILKDTTFDFALYSGSLLMITMIGAAITHLWIGDYKQIFGNLFLLFMIYFVTFSPQQSVES
tara:strand:+ start:5423 stop:6178 length:756 start_codon:yes stop_codon:yes gene_type:complete